MRPPQNGKANNTSMGSPTNLTIPGFRKYLPEPMRIHSTRKHSEGEHTMPSTTRRQFLATTAGAAAIAAATAHAGAPAPATSFAWTPRKPVNPSIDNLRVVCGVNPAMITGEPVSWEMDAQNAPVSAEQVARTLDAMVVSLTQKASATDGWATVFQKPATKKWPDVKVAIKVNCIAKNHPRVAVLNKICDELIRLGVASKAITMYDGCHDASGFYTAFVGKGLPAGLVVSKKSDALGGMAGIATPAPREGTYECTRALVDGSVDILVNVAVNKGHSQQFGGTTLTLKNHAGTFEPRPLHTGGGLDYLLAFNKSDAILGGSPVRQQLCIIDSLWGAIKGPGGVPDKRLDRLVMGTFSPAVDYLTARKIREPLLGASHENLDRFLTDFGYAVGDAGEMVEVKL